MRELISSRQTWTNRNQAVGGSRESKCPLSSSSQRDQGVISLCTPLPDGSSRSRSQLCQASLCMALCPAFPSFSLSLTGLGLHLPKNVSALESFLQALFSRGPRLFLNWLILEYIQRAGIPIARHSPVEHFVQNSSETHVECGFPSATPIICKLEPAFHHLALRPVDVPSV